MSDRLGWLRLNAYALLIAGLAIVSGLEGIISPDSLEIVEAVGYPFVTMYVWSGGTLTGGLLMLASLLTRRTLLEALGLAAIISSAILRLSREGLVYGWTSPETIRFGAVVALLVFCAWLRMSGLWPREPQSLTIGRRS